MATTTPSESTAPRDSDVSGGPARFFALSLTPTGVALAGTCGRGISRSDDRGRSWEPVEGPDGGGSVHAFALEPDGSVLATTGSGLHRSSDEGRTWEPVGLDGNTLFGFDALDATGELVVGSEGAGVWCSQDRGATWAGPQPGLHDATVYRVLGLADDRVLAATEERGVWCRERGTWRPSGLEGVTVYALADLGGGVVLAGTRGHGIHRSVDSGASWARVETGPDDPVVHVLTVAADGAVLAGTGRGVVRSEDGGSTWETMGESLSDRRIFSLAADSEVVLAGSYDAVFRWSTAEPGWTPVETGLTADETFAVGVGGDGRALAGTKVGPVESLDGGRSWTALDTGMDGVIAYTFRWTSSGQVLAGTADGVRALAPGERAWRAAGLEGHWVYSLLELEDRRVLAGTMGSGVFARNGPDSDWIPSSDGCPNPLAFDFVATRAGDVLVATGVTVDGAKTGAVFRSSDGGRSWTPTDGEPIVVYRVVEDSAGRVFAGAQRCHVLVSVDGGLTWEQHVPELAEGLKMYNLAIDRDDRLYLGAGARLLRSDDGAESWHEVGDGLDGVTVYDLAEQPDGVLLAATSAGLFTSDDHGVSWLPPERDQPPSS